MSYDNWKKRLEIAKLPTVAARRAELSRLKLANMEPTVEDEGYYRIPITEKDASGNGRNIVTGYIPVAIWDAGMGLVGVKGTEQNDMRTNEIVDQWTWFCTHPVAYETYLAVAEGGEPWPDLGEIVRTDDRRLPAGTRLGEAVPVSTERVALMNELGRDVPAANREVAKTDNAPPPEEEIPLDVQHATAIDNAIGAAKDLPVTTVEEAAVAAGAANIIRERRLAAEKVAKTRVDPLLRVYEEERNKWLTPVKRAKDAEGAVRTKVSDFEISERKRVAAEQLAALERQREIDEAAARAADRAIAAGLAEQPPVVEEVVIPQAPPPVKPTYGTYTPRAKPILKFAVIEDAAKVLDFYKLNYKVIELIQQLATEDIRAGLEVPGATSREGTS